MTTNIVCSVLPIAGNQGEQFPLTGMYALLIMTTPV